MNTTPRLRKTPVTDACVTPPPPGEDPTPATTLPLPLYARIAGEPFSGENSTIRVPLTVKGHDWGEVIIAP